MTFPATLMIAALIQANAAPEASPASDRLRAAVPVIAGWANVTLEGYEVTGRSKRSIRTAMNAARPATASGARHDAVTRWRYSYQMGGANGRCDPAQSVVSHSIVVVMPDLAGVDRLSRGDRAAWEAYFAALTTHESNHIRIAEAGARGIQSAMRAAPDCETARAVAAREIQTVSAASAEYDRLTGHGRTEGAVY